MTTTPSPKQTAAASLAGWFKKYKTPEEQFNGEGYEQLLLCAIHCICAAKEDPEAGASEEEIVAFEQGIQQLLIQQAAFQLMRRGEVATTIRDGELAWSALADKSLAECEP